MSRRTHACLACPGRTRHDNQVCASCRRRGVTARDGELRVPLRISWATPADVHAPTVAELEAGVDLTGLIQSISTGARR